MDQTIQGRIEAYLKKYGFYKLTGKDVWYMGTNPHRRVVDLEKEPPWIGLSTGVQNQEAEECGIDQVLDIKNNVLAIYNNSIKKLPGTGDQNPVLSQEGSELPRPNASPPAPGGESHPITKAPIFCDLTENVCISDRCIFYGRTEPILGKVCPLIKSTVPAPKIYRCKDCSKQIDKEQAEKTFKGLDRALCGPCVIKERGARV